MLNITMPPGWVRGQGSNNLLAREDTKDKAFDKDAR
jgi:hypothetical protein